MEKLNGIIKKIFPDSTGLSFAMLATGFAEVLFLMFIMALDVLPFTFVLMIIAALVLIDVLIIKLVNSNRHKRTKTIATLVIIVLLLILLTIGDLYAYSTYDTLQKISEQRETWENYDVITLKGGSYNEIDDIKGKEVHVVDMESKQLEEAMERLITKEEVTYSKTEGLISLGQTIVGAKSVKDDKEIAGAASGEVTEEDIAKAAEEETADNAGILPTQATEAEPLDAEATVEPEDTGLHDEIILVSHSGYKLMKNNIKSFKKNTQIIERIKVMKRGNDNEKAVDVTKDSFNVLISGLDSWGTIDQGGLSDVNMVMTVNPVTREVLLTSIPRDSYVPLHSYGQKDKLTHSGIYGEEETRQTIEDLLDIDINYTVRINFSTLVDIIDAIGGLDIYSDYDFHSAISAHKYHKGWQHLSGRGCLYFARERKAFENGDMQRNKHQQKVLKAAIKKISNSRVILASYTKILDSVENELSMTLTNRDIKRLAKMQLSDMSKWEVKTVNITGSTGMAPCFSMGNQELSCVFPSEETVNKAKEAIHEVMYPGENTEDQEMVEDPDNEE